MGGCGVSQDKVLASAMYLLAATHGHAGAQFNIATCYTRGLGVPVNYKLASKWFRKAAEKGDIRTGRAVSRLTIKLQIKRGFRSP